MVIEGAWLARARSAAAARMGSGPPTATTWPSSTSWERAVTRSSGSVQSLRVTGMFDTDPTNRQVILAREEVAGFPASLPRTTLRIASAAGAGAPSPLRHRDTPPALARQAKAPYDSASRIGRCP